jgi:hypothetical protein
VLPTLVTAVVGPVAVVVVVSPAEPESPQPTTILHASTPTADPERRPATHR